MGKTSLLRDSRMRINQHAGSCPGSIIIKSIGTADEFTQAENQL
jgi:hypothetical protein